MHVNLPHTTGSLGLCRSPRPRLRRLLHGFATELHQAQPSLKVEDTRHGPKRHPICLYIYICIYIYVYIIFF